MAWLLLLLTETAAAGPDQPWNEGDVEMFGGGIFALLALGFIFAAIKSFPLQAISLLLGTIAAYASSFIVGGAGGLLFGCLVVVLAPRWINEFIVSIRTKPNTDHAQSGDKVTSSGAKVEGSKPTTKRASNEGLQGTADQKINPVAAPLPANRSTGPQHQPTVPPRKIVCSCGSKLFVSDGFDGVVVCFNCGIAHHITPPH